MKVSSAKIYTGKDRTEILKEIEDDFLTRFDYKVDPNYMRSILEDELINAYLNRTYMRKDFMDAIIYAIANIETNNAIVMKLIQNPDILNYIKNG